MRARSVFLLLAIALASAEAEAAPIDNLDGFRGIKWRDSVSDHADFTVAKVIGRTKHVVRHNDQLEFFGIPVGYATNEKRHVFWYLFDERLGFFGVTIGISEDLTESQLQRAISRLEADLGPAERTASGGNYEYLWKGARVRLLLDVKYRPALGLKGRIYLTFVPVEEERDRERKAARTDGF